MKLCVISPYPPDLNGIGAYAHSIVRGLAATGRFSEITVLSQQPELPAGFADIDGHPIVHSRQLWARDETLAAARLARAIRAERADALWLNFDFTMFGASRPANFLGVLGALAGRRSGRPLVVTM